MWPHTPADGRLVLDGDELAHRLYTADNVLAKAVGVMGRRGLPADAALVFDLDGVRPRTVHMVGVRAPIRVWWVADGRLEHTARLPAWTGVDRARADYIVELPTDAPAGEPGDAEAGDADPATRSTLPGEHTRVRNLKRPGRGTP